MKSKKILIPLVLALCIVISLISVNALNNKNSLDKKDLLNAANRIQQSFSQKKDMSEVATANGISIYMDELELRKDIAMITMHLDEKEAYKDSIKRIARNKVLYKMSEDMGLALSREQALEASLQEREMVKLDQKALENNNEYIAALGLTEEQYWTEYHVNEKQQFLSIERLKAYYANEAIEKGSLPKVEVHTKETSKQYKDYLKQVTDEIESSINIEFKDEKIEKLYLE